VTQPGAGLVRLRRPRWILLAVLLVLAGALVFVIHRGQDPEASGASLLIARAVHELLTHPEPYVPELLRIGIESVTWVTVLAVLIFNPRGRMMSAAVALALVARGNLDIPLCAGLLAIAALVLGLHPGPDLGADWDVQGEPATRPPS